MSFCISPFYRIFFNNNNPCLLCSSFAICIHGRSMGINLTYSPLAMLCSVFVLVRPLDMITVTSFSLMFFSVCVRLAWSPVSRTFPLRFQCWALGCVLLPRLFASLHELLCQCQPLSINNITSHGCHHRIEPSIMES